MKIAIYGVSRAGKDYFINKLQQYFSEKGETLYHLKGSETLNNFALENYGIPFKQCDESEKKKLRKNFVSYVKKSEKKYKHVAVDGHYSFYNEKYELNKVFTDNDMNCYDKFFYLEASSTDIVERMRNSKGSKHNDDITVEQVRQWQDYEIDGLTDDLLIANKDLHIIKFGDKALQYVFDCVTTDCYDSYRIAQILLSELTVNTPCVILTDCDCTLSLEDSSTLAMKYAQISENGFKEIFENNRYSNFQMKLANEYSAEKMLYNEKSIDYILQNMTANQPLIEDLLSLKNVSIIGMTAGNIELWKKILTKFGLAIPLLGREQMPISKQVKCFAVKELQARGKYVIALGDSLLDSLMLRQANKGYIITAKGYRKYLEKFLSENHSVKQLGYLPLCYSSSEKEKTISALKPLPSNKYVCKANSICKSDSGQCGTLLRKTHYNLGKRIAAMIKCDFRNDNFVIVSMLRSGVPFSFGAADYLDCPILFYSENDTDSFKQQLNENPQLKNATFVLCDAVINSGKTVKTLLDVLNDKKCIIAANVLSDKFNELINVPVYAVRVSVNSYVGAKQTRIFNGKGPDTSDRLYNLIYDENDAITGE